MGSLARILEEEKMIEKLQERREELLQIKSDKESEVRELQVLQVTKHAELNDIFEQIAETNWDTSVEKNELEEIDIALAVLNRL